MALRTLLLAAALVCLAGPASAVRIEFVWQATGTNAITVLPGQEVVLEGRVVTEGDDLYGVSVSALAPTGLLTATGFEVCPTGCSPLVPAGLTNIMLNNASDSGPVAGLSGSFAALGLTPRTTDLLLFELTYQVLGVGSGQVVSYYRDGIDGVATDFGGVLFPPVVGADITSGITITVVPEPSTALLLAASLLALAAGRRSRTR